VSEAPSNESIPEGSAEEPLVPLGQPPAMPPRRGSDLVKGLGLMPEQMIAAFSADQLELLVARWLSDSVEHQYARVLRRAGPGDRGRDVIAYAEGEGKDPWDSYQCKHYAQPLTPATVLDEIAKLVYWVSEGAYTRPRTYVFAAPKGVGPKTDDLLKDHDEIRDRLKKDWPKHGKTLCPLEAISAALDAFEFPDFEVATAERIVTEMQSSAIYPVLFGGGLTKPRPPDKKPPETIAGHEVGYVAELVAAYKDHGPGEKIADPEDALAHGTYGAHLRLSRRQFYCAESLREFSKDVLAHPDDYASLREEIHGGIEPTLFMDYANGYDRVRAVCQHATLVEVSDHPLRGELRAADRAGMCHQLANDGEVRWVSS
jgi:hypothetical protein